MNWLIKVEKKLKEYFYLKLVKPEPRKMPLIYCVDCDQVREATQAMRCSNCGSDATTVMTRYDAMREAENKFQFRDI